MEIEIAKQKMCPLLGTNCLTCECMAWETTDTKRVSEIDDEEKPTKGYCKMFDWDKKVKL